MKLEQLHSATEILACPETKLSLELVELSAAEERVSGKLWPRAESRDVTGRLSEPIGRTDWVLLREDLRCAYPVVDGVPVLLAPEALTTAERRQVDLTEPRYAEAYAEMAFYNAVAASEAATINRSESYDVVAPALAAPSQWQDSFPHPKEVWIDATYDCLSQWDAYSHLRPITGRRLLQLGGKGTHAIKFLLAGAAEAWALTPMLGEALCAEALAKETGVAQRARCVVAVAEELPLKEATLDGVYSGGCLHHMQTDLALGEASRVLRPGGKFAAMDPWRAPLYSVGTRVFGRREPADSVFDRPLTHERLGALWTSFEQARIAHHGSLTRYLLIALAKMGVESSLATVWHVNRMDDMLCSLLPGARRMGSSVAVMGTG